MICRAFVSRELSTGIQSMGGLKIAFYFAISVFVVLSLDPPSDCVPKSIDRLCRQSKCKGFANFQNCVNIVSPYPGGNQCCNQKTLTALSRKSKRQFYNFATNPSAKWTLPVLYYVNFSQSNFELIIRTAINTIESSSCVYFTQVSSPPNESYISFNRYSQGCVSFVGRSEKLSSSIYGDDSCYERPGTIIYLIVQTLGLWHQTQRPDASKNVKILRENMDQSHWADFNPVAEDYIVTLGFQYDYASLTHYAGKVFSINGQPTIETLDPLYQQTIGQKVELSFQDSKLLNYFYCGDQCSIHIDCLNGGFINGKNCSECICPDGFQGNRCELFRVDQTTSLESGDCGGGRMATSDNQELTSPGYSRGFYPSYIHCQWIITAPEGENISMKFVGDFGIYSDEYDACQHWIEIRFKPPFNNTGPRFCGQNLPLVSLNSSSGNVLIIFKSDDIGVTLHPQKGFRLQYKLISDNQESCTPNPCENEGSCTVSGSNITCLCTSKYSGERCQIELDNSTDPCSTKPCKNQGTCQISGTAYICLCLKPFYGKQCEHANCGGCDTRPGLICDKKCRVESDNCTIRSTLPHFLWRKFRNFFNHYFGSTTCEETQSLCCDNAVEVRSRCAAIGWTNWSECSSNCGPGQQMKYKYGVQDGNYKIVGTERRNCTGVMCRKIRLPFPRWW